MPAAPLRSSPFVGRESELAALLAAWEGVAAGRGPRTVVVLAESGLGKTRLAQALYEALAAGGAATAAGERGYWPPLLGRDGNNLRVNPPLDACATAAPLPFLWWGIRLVDPLAPNHLAGGVLPSSVERDLLPHLEPLQREARRRQRRSRVARVAAGLVGDAVVDALPFASLLKTLVSTGLELKGIHDEGRRDGGGRDPSGAAEARALTFLDRVVGDLGALLRPAAVPAVVLVDDGQFSPHDPGVVALVTRLQHEAAEQGWPLLLLITHWEQEWRKAAPGSLAAALQGDSPATGGEGGPVEELRLAPLPDLGPWLRAELPGLTEPQQLALLARAGGNPRYLDEILRFAAGVRGRGLFEGRDPTRALTDAGLSDLLARSVALLDLIADRLAASPDTVQQAVVLAALQARRCSTTSCPAPPRPSASRARRSERRSPTPPTGTPTSPGSATPAARSPSGSTWRSPGGTWTPGSTRARPRRRSPRPCARWSPRGARTTSTTRTARAWRP